MVTVAAAAAAVKVGVTLFLAKCASAKNPCELVYEKCWKQLSRTFCDLCCGRIGAAGTTNNGRVTNNESIGGNAESKRDGNRAEHGDLSWGETRKGRLGESNEPEAL
jgi:hypothetical protein